jgi:transposase
MMGRLDQNQERLFYSFCLDEVVPDDHLVREIAAVLDLSWVHAELTPYYSRMGRPSIDPVLMIRLLVIGYVFAIRSERALCREVQVNLAYRWFCGLSIEAKIPDHSAFSRARNERFRDSDLLRHVFERVIEACLAAGLVGGDGFAIDASLIVADANKQRSIPGSEWSKTRDPATASRAVKEYLATLNDAAFGAATDVEPKFVSPSDPAARWTGAMRGPAFFAYADNYLIDVKCGIIMDVEASRCSPGGGRLGEDHDRPYRRSLRPASGAARGRHRLWVGGDAELAGRRAEHRAPHSGHRQISAPRWHLCAGRFPL